MADISISYTYGRQKGGMKVPATKKIGRPTDNPKTIRITIRMDKNTFQILDNYCKQENLEHAEAVRRGIRELEKNLNK